MAENEAPERVWLVRGSNGRWGKRWYIPNVNVQHQDNYQEFVRADLAAPDAAQLLMRVRAALELLLRHIRTVRADESPDAHIPVQLRAGDIKQAREVLRDTAMDTYNVLSALDDLARVRRETWQAAETIAKERAQEYATRADTEIAAGNQSIGDAWANWMKGAERTRQAIRAAALRESEESGDG